MGGTYSACIIRPVMILNWLYVIFILNQEGIHTLIHSPRGHYLATIPLTRSQNDPELVIVRSAMCRALSDRSDTLL